MLGGCTIATEGAISHNTWMHRLVRGGVRPLVGTGITPNHLTTARLVCGLAAAGCFAVGPQAWNHAGAAVFVVAMLLDRADGELARLGGGSSPFGHLYDLAADGISNAAAFLCIGVGMTLSGGPFAPLALPLGIIAGIAAAFVEIMVIRMDAAGVQKSSDLGGAWGFDPDDAMLLVPVAMAFDMGGPLLIAAAIGAPAMLGFFTWRALQAR